MRDRVLGSRTVFEGRILTLRIDEVEAADGHRSTREVIEHRGAVGVVVVDGDDIVLVRQYRHACGRELLEIPAGKLEEGEDPAETARRELIEEVGLRANRLEHWVTYYTTPGFSDERFHIYFTDDLDPAEGHTDPGEVLTVERHPVDGLRTLLGSGDLADAKSLLGLSMLAMRL